MKKRKKGKGKVRDMRRHTQRRLVERFNLPKTVYDKIIGLIQAGESEFVGKQSSTRSVHDVKIQGQVVRAVYDPSRNALRTVTDPEEMRLVFDDEETMEQME